MEEPMLDARTETFLVVARTLNYTKAAKELFITQPAVTQHIQFLEREYGVKLFKYASRELSLTQAGEIFLKYIQESKAEDKIIGQRLAGIKGGKMKMNFAATLTIGEFTLAPIFKDFYNKFDNYKINIQINNTEQIIKRLDNGELQFAFIEGLFNKNNYNTKLLKEEDFILVVNPEHSLAKKKHIVLKDIVDEKIIVRELGSGSREILERGLYDKNYSLEDFADIVEIGNVALMKRLVIDNIGISFMYYDAARIEIQEGRLSLVELEDFKLLREFNFVTINKPSIIEQTDRFFEFFKANICNTTTNNKRYSR
jgi:DNA-binding transcriptional LysR family regulator